MNEPSHIHPFNEGQYAAERGESEYDCPYAGDSWERTAWQHGWDYYDEKVRARSVPIGT